MIGKGIKYKSNGLLSNPIFYQILDWYYFEVLSDDIIPLNKILSGLILTFAIGKSYTIN